MLSAAGSCAARAAAHQAGCREQQRLLDATLSSVYTWELQAGRSRVHSKGTEAGRQARWQDTTASAGSIHPEAQQAAKHAMRGAGSKGPEHGV